MLILTRKPGESLYIGDVKVTIVELKGHQIRIGIDAPPEIRIYREEIYVQILEENRKAAEAAMSTGSGLEGLPANWKGKPSLGGPTATSDDSGNSESKPKKPTMGGLATFSTSSGSFSKQKGHGDRNAPNDPEVVIRKKSKRPDE